MHVDSDVESEPPQEARCRPGIVQTALAYMPALHCASVRPLHLSAVLPDASTQTDGAESAPELITRPSASPAVVGDRPDSTQLQGPSPVDVADRRDSTQLHGGDAPEDLVAGMGRNAVATGDGLDSRQVQGGSAGEALVAGRESSVAASASGQDIIDDVATSVPAEPSHAEGRPTPE